jgi:hypothetical protein
VVPNAKPERRSYQYELSSSALHVRIPYSCHEVVQAEYFFVEFDGLVHVSDVETCFENVIDGRWWFCAITRDIPPQW